MLDHISIYCDKYEIKINADKTILLIFNYLIDNDSEINKDEWAIRSNITRYIHKS
jgi:hypothetical protein